MRLTIKVSLYLLLIIVALYCGNKLINRIAPRFRISTSLQKPSPLLWDNLTVRSSSDPHKITEEIRIVKEIQPTISDVKEINELSSQESQHVSYSTNRLLEQQPGQETKGYILPFSVNEEQTNGAKNLWQLQIWANLVKMHVVEPFAQHSVFTMSGIAPNFSEALQFGDYFDLTKWNAMVVKTHGSPLVKWEEFIAKAPRDVILLYMTRGKFTEPLTIAYDNDVDQHLHNKILRIAIPETDLKWIYKNFNVIKRVCYLSAANKPHSLTIEKFNSYIFGDMMPNKVSLIIKGWEGIRPSRINITPIYAFLPVFSPGIIFPPSKRILDARRSYVAQYIGNRTYVGIIFRSHHIYFYNRYWRTRNYTGMAQTLLHCSKKLKQELDKIRTHHEIFLAIDLGTFGSKRYSSNIKLTPLKNQIHSDVFNGSLTADQREERLKNAAGGITDCGFIAQLEKVIATNADCIILLGSKSGFVSTSVSLYVTHHPTDKCIVGICYDDKHNHALLSSHIPEKFM